MLHSHAFNELNVMKDNLLDESKYKGQDKYCVACDTSDKKDYTSVVIHANDQKLTKSELIEHCEKEIEFHPKNSRRYKEHYILL